MKDSARGFLIYLQRDLLLYVCRTVPKVNLWDDKGALLDMEGKGGGSLQKGRGATPVS